MSEHRNSGIPGSAAPMSATAVTGFVLGVVGLVLSPIPIINNFSFVLAVLGVVFSIVGLLAASRGTRKGRPLAVAGLVLGVIAFVAVIVTQSIYSAALKEALTGPSVTGLEPAGAAQGADQPESAGTADYSALEVGTAASLSNGLSVGVTAVQTGLSNYDGSAVTGVSVSYENKGGEEAAFNLFDWKGEDSQGAQRRTTVYPQGSDQLSSGTLAPGGAVFGTVYFEGDLSKVLYYSSVLNSSSSAVWVLSA